MPNNLADLKKFMLEEWEKISDSTLDNLIGSMKERCQLVIGKRGENTSFIKNFLNNK
jgi:hypothetical protein